MNTETALQRAADILDGAQSLWIGTGAGMGVDSGLPDFRGNEGFWNAYPPYRELGLSFYDLANPHWFHANPSQAWGFYGHRLNLYRETVPHRGFAILKSWVQVRFPEYFVFTSNVDGHFQESGFDDDRIIECHGSIHFLQCAHPCAQSIWATAHGPIQICPSQMLAEGELPSCPSCGQVARPNILMFGDYAWLAGRTEAQEHRYRRWLSKQAEGLVALEIGAGTAVPTVRYEAHRVGARVIRVNPRERNRTGDELVVPCGALEFFDRISSLWGPT